MSNRDTEQAPPLSQNDIPTEPDGVDTRAPADLLSDDAIRCLMPRMVEGIEHLIQEMRGMRTDLRLVLHESRVHAERLTLLEQRVAALEAAQ